MDEPIMTQRWISDGTIWVKIHCGCCGSFFKVPLGGSAFCVDCIEGEHKNCKLIEIMGIRS